jgi:hypothetical protein
VTATKATLVVAALIAMPAAARADAQAAEDAYAQLHQYRPEILLACRDARFDAARAASYVAGCTDDDVRADCALLDHPGTTEGVKACGFQAIASWVVCHGDHPPADCNTRSDGTLGDAAMRRTGAAGSVFSVEPTTILLGATDFFVARAKKELMLFLRDRIAGALCPEDNEIAKRLLPSTCVALKPADDTSLEDTLSGLREAFQDDLRRLPQTVLDEIAALPDLDAKAKTLVCFGSVAYDAGETYVKSGAWAAFKELLLANPDTCAAVISWQATKPVRDVFEKLIGRVEYLMQSGSTPDADAIATLLNDIAADAAGNEDVRKAVEFVGQQIPKIRRLVELLRRLRGNEHGDLELGRQAVEAAFDLLATLIEIPTVSIDKELQRNIVALQRAISAALQRDYVTALIRLAAVPMLRVELKAKLPEKARKVLDGLERFGATIGEIAKAETPEDVATVLENAASPAGSWREFRRRNWPGFISGVLGVGMGVEYARDARDGGFAAAALPIGLETGRKLGGGFTMNFLFPILDLGALANLRLDDTASGASGGDGMPKAKPELDFASVLAPGFFLEIGIGASPFVVGAGFEYVPAARRYFDCDMVETCETTKLAPATRFMVFLGVDMPILPLW